MLSSFEKERDVISFERKREREMLGSFERERYMLGSFERKRRVRQRDAGFLLEKERQ